MAYSLNLAELIDFSCVTSTHVGAVEGGNRHSLPSSKPFHYSKGS